MSIVMGKLRKKIFGIAADEATFERRGFTAHSETAQRHLEEIGVTFLEGYHAALPGDDTVAIERRLGHVPRDLQGFAFEGAAMALALTDSLSFRKSRLKRFMDGPGARHTYMIHVGAGWAFARLPGAVDARARRLHPLYGWLAIDGYGFHQGYFHWPAFVGEQRRPRRLSGYALRAFDQGLGRSLWFVRGADPHAIADAIAPFDRDRHADFWSGVGLACTYAGGVGSESVLRLRNLASAHRASLAQGAAFAAEARERAGNPTRYTSEACEILCGMSAASAGELARITAVDLPFDHALPAYEHWRARLRTALSHHEHPAGTALSGELKI